MIKLGKIETLEYIEDVVNSSKNYKAIKQYLLDKGGIIDRQSNGSSYFIFKNVVGYVRVSNHFAMSLKHETPSISIYSNSKDNYVEIIESLEKLIN